MPTLSLRKNAPFEVLTLGEMIPDETEMALVNPNAKFPLDPLEWQEKWLNELDDASFYLTDAEGRDVGFFALRVGIGPEVRHLTYAFVAPEARGGSGEQMTALVIEAARQLEALTLTLKCETDNAPAMNAYLSAGFEVLSERGGMATMRMDLG
ncbi:Acetyltransferase (GNAT) family protein [Roseivivax sp. THAF40]|uniref:GNAT family N-acetyltransferase n=1 Tax=unclassified Roseivivax TaxID=2639302 RepID=UPI0012687459|nr:MULTISPECIES: GNAT family N-acetyltransferase [unclassified Roseivivax]QFS81266.1 Acetyltransferase (GNAT) family protein [Roseivivax sp. THAF197b]QFT44995.1 Acetyltransferase (GNAT) family protein [Roseivivax sp. THAF40]